MIERYLKAGLRVKWNAPAATQQALDGAIVNNRGVSSTMTYDGLDGELINPAFMVTNVTSMGFTMRMPIPHVWLDYNYGRTSRCPSGQDILTGFMSGCIIARWTQLGVGYVGHVGTLVANPTVNTLVKNTFLGAVGNDVTGFNPAAAWTDSECQAIANKFKKKPASKIMALVTNTGAFYSILMLQLDWTKADEWCVGGIKSVPAMNHAALVLEMNKM
jgi:hypothetical protein